MGKYTSRGVSSFFLRAAAAIISLAVVVTFAEKLLRLA